MFSPSSLIENNGGALGTSSELELELESLELESPVDASVEVIRTKGGGGASEPDRSIRFVGELTPGGGTTNPSGIFQLTAFVFVLQKYALPSLASLNFLQSLPGMVQLTSPAGPPFW